MRTTRRRVVSGTFLLALCAARAGTLAGAKPEKDETWQQTAKRAGVGAADVPRLATSKVLMTNRAYKQVFQPYLRSDVPLFITSDSLLNAFHVLFEESVLRLEKANARKLPPILRFAWTNLATLDVKVKGKPALGPAAKARAQIVVGTALELLGDETTKPDARIAALIGAEAKKILEAKAVEKPAWLGPPDATFTALDYSRYKPRGFYTRTPALQRYFRAVAWLQSIPFRVRHDEELLAILMLGNAVTYRRFRDDFVRQEGFKAFFRGYQQLLGAGDDWDLMTAAHVAQNLRSDLDEDALATERKNLRERARDFGDGPAINDQLRFAPGDPTKAAEIGFRVISACRTPDAVLFQRTTDLRRFQRPFPNGLEVLAVLGSAHARSKLTGRDRQKLLTTLDACKSLFRGDSLYLEYLGCLATLLDAPEPDAPPFMKGEPWQAKSCQTALAGWAQLRHTWALQAKQTAHFLGLTQAPPGFVEPEPDFFARMASLVERAERLLDRAGALAPDTAELAANIRETAALLRKTDAANKGTDALKGLSQDQMMKMETPLTLGMVLAGRGGGDDMVKRAARALPKLEALADRLARGERPTQPMVRRIIKEFETDLRALWRRLGAMCRRLEALAHKQLRGVALNDGDRGFIQRYGVALAGIMLYGGNAYLTPRDDAPRVVDVFANPNVGRVLEVGIARARALYVLYPWQGKELLCLGAVLPYYELTSAERLSDAEWKALLASPKRPGVPAWLRPIVGSEGIGVPELKDGH